MSSSEPPEENNGEASELEGLDPANLMDEVQKPISSAAATPPGGWEPPLPAQLADLMPGYEILALIGRGGMGAVYKGVQKSLDREVAIKLLPPELGADPEFEARFKREAKSMAKLNHPNIVQIYDFGQTTAGHHYFVMEFVDGTDLHRLIRAGELQPEGALNAVSQICDALEYAHEEGFVHRDIKPANIFINGKGILKVGDFGLAKLVDGDDAAAVGEQMGLTMTGVAMGTPHYIAPEQMVEGNSVDRRADIYSLGVMFYEMLTGEIPRGAVKEPSKKIPQLDARIDDVVFKSMESDPDERYQSATDLRTDVDVIRTTPGEEAAEAEDVPVAQLIEDEPAAPVMKVKAKKAGGKSSGGTGATKGKAKPVSSEAGPKKKSPALIAAMVGVPLLVLVAFALFKGGNQGSNDDSGTASQAPNEASEATDPSQSSVAKTKQPLEFVSRLRGVTFYRTTNSANSITFGADDGKLVMSTLEGKTPKYSFVVKQPLEIEFRFSDGRPVRAVFTKDLSKFVLDDQSEWTRTQNKSFATKLDEARHFAAGTEWLPDGSREALKFGNQLKQLTVPSGTNYPLSYSGDGYRFLFKWGQSDGDNWVDFDANFRTGRFFDSNKKGGKAVKMVLMAKGGPALEDSSPGEKSESAPSITGANGLPSGRLRAIGSISHNGEKIPVVQPEARDDFVACSTKNGWQAVTGSGELVVGWVRNLPEAPIENIGPEGLVGRNVAITRAGKLVGWGDNIWERIGADEKVRLFDAAHRFGVAVFEDGTVRVWNTLSSEPEKVFQPDPGDVRNIKKVSASNCGVTFLREDGSVLFCSSEQVRGGDFEMRRYVDIDDVVNGFIGLTAEGKVISWGDADRVQVPEDLPKLTAIRGGGRIAAGLTESGRWVAWSDDESKPALQEISTELATLQNVIDLDLHGDNLAGRLAWIEPAEPKLDSRIFGKEWTFTENEGGSQGDVTITVTPEHVNWKSSERERQQSYQVVGADEIVVDWGGIADRGIRFDVAASTLEAWRTKNPEASKVSGQLVQKDPAEGKPTLPADPIASGLAAIEAKFEARYTAEVDAVHKAAVQRLDRQIGAALKREQDAAAKTGELDAVLQWKRAIERLEGGKGVPGEAEIAAEDPPVVRPGKLLTFYRTYREQVAGLEAARDDRAKPLLKMRDQALEQYQRELTQAKNIDGALRVKAVREATPLLLTVATEPPVPEALPAAAESPAKPVAMAPTEGLSQFRQGRLHLQMGSKLSKFDISAAEGIADFVDVSSIGSGWAALRQDGTVIGWTSNGGRFSQPGIVKLIQQQRPDLMGISTAGVLVRLEDGSAVLAPENGRKVVDAAVQQVHSIALLDDGTIRTWGRSYEKAGPGDDQNFPQPPKEALKDITMIAATRYDAWVVTKRGELIGWGGKQWHSSDVPNALRRITGIWSTPFFALALGSDRELIRFDRNNGAVRIVEKIDLQTELVRCGEYGPLGLVEDRWQILGAAGKVSEIGLDDAIGALTGASLPLLWLNTDSKDARGNLLWLSADDEPPSTAPASAGDLLEANKQRYQIDYSRSGTLKVAGTVRRQDANQAVPQPTAEQAKDISFVASAHEDGGRWMAVKKDGTVISPQSNGPGFAIPRDVDKPRWLDLGKMAIAVHQNGNVTMWGAETWEEPKHKLRRVVKAESSYANAIALHEDGTVTAWGPMYEEHRFHPDPTWLKGAIDVAAGMNRAWVLKADGTVIGWDVNGDLATQDPAETKNINGAGEQAYIEMRDLRAISGNHRNVIGIDSSGGWRRHGNATTPGVFRRVVPGQMLTLGISEENRIVLQDTAEALQRFAEIAPALEATKLIWADGAGEGTDPGFAGFIAWIEAD